MNSILNKKFKYTYKSVSMYIVAINIVVYIALEYLNITIKGVPLMNYLCLVPGFVKFYGFYWQFVTYMFVHYGLAHLLLNMYALAVFGSMIERAIGSKEFTLFYFVVGTLGGVISYFIYLATGTMLVAVMGASGAIYGILFLTAVMFPENRVLLFFFIPMKLPVAILAFFLIEIISQISGGGADISHLVHLSGMFIAWIYCVVRFRISPVKVFRASFFRR